MMDVTSTLRKSLLLMRRVRSALFKISSLARVARTAQADPQGLGHSEAGHEINMLMLIPSSPAPLALEGLGDAMWKGLPHQSLPHAVGRLSAQEGWGDSGWLLGL